MRPQPSCGLGGHARVQALGIRLLCLCALGASAADQLAPVWERITSAPSLNTHHDPEAWMRPAQTVHQLALQMIETGRYSPAEIEQVMRAHHLAIALTGDAIRGQGRPNDAHFVSTASLSVHWGQPLQATLVMLCHAVATLGKLDCGPRRGLQALTRTQLYRLLVDSEVGFSTQALTILTRWQSKGYHGGKLTIANMQGANGSRAADIATLWALNQLDEYLGTYLVGFDLLPPTPSPAILRAIGAEKLEEALRAAAARLGRLAATNPRHWRVVARYDPVYDPFTFRLSDARWGHDTDGVPRARTSGCRSRLPVPLSLSAVPLRKTDMVRLCSAAEVAHRELWPGGAGRAAAVVADVPLNCTVRS
ncbi:hypothetical protein T492DRAFT_998628, partial [Pavlovales sp. CCMP2436]